MKAQDPISNNTPFGAYTGSNQNVIINNDPFFFSNTSNANEIDQTGKNNFTGGDSNKIRNINSGDPTRANISYGKNNFVRDSRYSLAVGKDNFIREADPGIALGEDNKIDGGLLNVDNLISIGRNTQNFQSESIILGFGANNNRLTQAGERSITLGTYNESTDEPFNTLNIRPPSSIGAFTAPVVGIGINNPSAKLEIQNRGEDGNTAQALSILNSDGDPLFNVREDGWTGFSSNPSAPYFFTETNFSPFTQSSSGDGKANIVQNYRGFPSIGGESKWLSLGERPPGPNGNQIAYGFASTWDAYSGNFFIEDFDEGPNDVTISFQDATTTEGATNAANRLRFIARDGQPINPTNNSIAEIMSLYPERQLAVGDYSENALDPQANRLEVKTDRDCGPGTDCNENGNEETIMEVLKNKNPGNPGGDELLTVRDDGFVGVQTDQFLTNPNTGNTRSDEFQVDGTAFSFDWFDPSDMRIKNDTSIIENPIEKVNQLNGITYRYDTMHPKIKHWKNTPKGKQAGVIAQQLKEVLPEAVSGSEKGLYKVSYNQIIPLLIETNKAQQKQIEKLKKKTKTIKSLRNKVEELEQEMQEMQNKQGAKRFKSTGDQTLNQKTVTIGDDNRTKAMLLQNRPNPYSDKTTIPYYLPDDFNQANMLITDINGQLVKRVPLEQSGKGELTLRTEGLNAGQYIYSLIVDGRKIQSRKMVVNK